MNPKRKIIQLTAIPGDEEYNPVLCAVCNDGTVWTASYDFEEGINGWQRQVRPPAFDQDDLEPRIDYAE
jgi:hypothetical protein